MAEGGEFELFLYFWTTTFSKLQVLSAETFSVFAESRRRAIVCEPRDLHLQPCPSEFRQEPLSHMSIWDVCLQKHEASRLCNQQVPEIKFRPAHLVGYS